MWCESSHQLSHHRLQAKRGTMHSRMAHIILSLLCASRAHMVAAKTIVFPPAPAGLCTNAVSTALVDRRSSALDASVCSTCQAEALCPVGKNPANNNNYLLFTLTLHMTCIPGGLVRYGITWCEIRRFSGTEAIVGLVLFFVCLFVAYKAYKNKIPSTGDEWRREWYRPTPEKNAMNRWLQAQVQHMYSKCFGVHVASASTVSAITAAANYTPLPVYGIEAPRSTSFFKHGYDLQDLQYSEVVQHALDNERCCLSKPCLDVGCEKMSTGVLFPKYMFIQTVFIVKHGALSALLVCIQHTNMLAGRIWLGHKWRGRSFDFQGHEADMLTSFYQDYWFFVKQTQMLLGVMKSHPCHPIGRYLRGLHSVTTLFFMYWISYQLQYSVFLACTTSPCDAELQLEYDYTEGVHPVTASVAIDVIHSQGYLMGISQRPANHSGLQCPWRSFRLYGKIFLTFAFLENWALFGFSKEHTNTARSCNLQTIWESVCGRSSCSR